MVRRKAPPRTSNKPVAIVSGGNAPGNIGTIIAAMINNMMPIAR